MIENPPRGTRIFKNDGDVLTLPSDQGDKFLEAYPDSQELVAFVNDGDTLTLPIEQAEAFQAKYKDAKDLFASKEPVKKKEDPGFQTAQEAISPLTPSVITPYDPAPEYKFEEGKELYAIHKEASQGSLGPLSPDEFHTMWSDMPEVSKDYSGESVFEGKVPGVAIKALDFLNTQDPNMPPNMYHKTAEDVVHNAMITKFGEEVIKDVIALEEDYQDVADRVGGTDQGVSQIDDPEWRENELKRIEKDQMQSAQKGWDGDRFNNLTRLWDQKNALRLLDNDEPTGQEYEETLTALGTPEQLKDKEWRAQETEKINNEIKQAESNYSEAHYENDEKLKLEKYAIQNHDNIYALPYSAAVEKVLSDPKYKDLTHDESNNLVGDAMMHLYSKSITESEDFTKAVDVNLASTNTPTPQEAISRLETATLRYGDVFTALQHTPEIDKIDETGHPVFSEDYIRRIQTAEGQAYEATTKKNPLPTEITNTFQYMVGNGMANGVAGQLLALVKGQPIVDTFGYQPNMVEALVSDAVAITSDMWIFELGGMVGSAAGKAVAGARLGKVMGSAEKMFLSQGYSKAMVDASMKTVLQSSKGVGIGASASSFATYEAVNETLNYYRKNGGNFDLADFSADVTKAAALGTLMGVGMGYFSHFAVNGKKALSKWTENRFLKATMKTENTIADKVSKFDMGTTGGPVIKAQEEAKLASKNSRLKGYNYGLKGVVSGSEWLASSGLLSLTRPVYEFVTEGKELDVDELGASFIHNLMLVGVLHGKSKVTGYLGLENRAINELMSEKSKSAFNDIADNKEPTVEAKTSIKDIIKKMVDLRLRENRGKIDLTPDEHKIVEEATGKDYKKLTIDEVAEVLAKPEVPFSLKQKMLMNSTGAHITNENIHFGVEIDRENNSVDLYDINGVLTDKIYDFTWTTERGVRKTTRLDNFTKLKQARDAYRERCNNPRMEWLEANIDTPEFNLSLPKEDRLRYKEIKPEQRNRLKYGEGLGETELADRDFVYEVERKMDKYTGDITKQLREANKAFEAQQKERLASEDKAKKVDDLIQATKNAEDARAKKSEDESNKSAEKAQRKLNDEAAKKKAEESRKKVEEEPVEKIQKPISGKVSKFKAGDRVVYEGEEYVVRKDKNGNDVIKNKNREINLNETKKEQIQKESEIDIDNTEKGSVFEYDGKVYEVKVDDKGKRSLVDDNKEALSDAAVKEIASSPKFTDGERIKYKGESYRVSADKRGNVRFEDAKGNVTKISNDKLSTIVKREGAKKGIPTFREGENLNYKGEDFTVHVDEGGKITLENDKSILEVTAENKGDISRNAKTELVTEIKEGDSVKYNGKTYRVEKNKRGDMMLESKTASMKLTDAIKEDIQREYEIIEQNKELAARLEELQPKSPEKTEAAKKHVKDSDARDKDVVDEVEAGTPKDWHPVEIHLPEGVWKTIDALGDNNLIEFADLSIAKEAIEEVLKGLEERKRIPAEAKYLEVYEEMQNFLHNKIVDLMDYGTAKHERTTLKTQLLQKMEELEAKKMKASNKKTIEMYEAWQNILLTEIYKLEDHANKETESKRKDDLKDIDASKRQTDRANKEEEFTTESTELKAGKPKESVEEKSYEEKYIDYTNTEASKEHKNSRTWRRDIKSLRTLDDLHDYLLEGQKIHPSQKAAFLKELTEKYSKLRKDLPVKERKMMFKKAKNLPSYKVIGKILEGLDIADRADVLKRLQRGDTHGFVNTKSGEMGLRGIDIETLAHELGHKTDLTYEMVENFLKNENLEALHDLRKFGVGSTTSKGDPFTYEFMEHYAEFIKEYLFDPMATYRKAPTLVDMLPKEMLKKLNDVTNYFQKERAVQEAQETNVKISSDMAESLSPGGIWDLLKKSNQKPLERAYSLYMEKFVNNEYDLERTFKDLQKMVMADDVHKKMDFDTFLILKRIAKGSSVSSRNQLLRGIVLQQGGTYKVLKDSKGERLTASSWTNRLDEVAHIFKKCCKSLEKGSNLQAAHKAETIASNVMVSQDIKKSVEERLPYQKVKEVLHRGLEISIKNAKIEADNKADGTHKKPGKQVGIPEAVWNAAVKFNPLLPKMKISGEKTYEQQYKEATGEAKEKVFDFTKNSFTGIREYHKKEGKKFETDYEASLDILENFENFEKIYGKGSKAVAQGIKDAMTDLRALNWSGIENLKDAKVISEELYQEFKLVKDDYISMKRMMVESFDKAGATIIDDASSYSNNVKLLKDNIFHARNEDGSIRDIQSLGLATMGNVEMMMRMADNNRARGAWHGIFQSINKQGGKQFNSKGLYEREVTKSQYDKLSLTHKGEVINYIEDGVMRYYKVSKEVADAFNMTIKTPMESEALRIWQQSLSFTREMITGVSGFAVSNMVRDFQSLVQYTKGGDVFVNFAKTGYYNSLGKSKKGDQIGWDMVSQLYESLAQQFSPMGEKFQIGVTNKQEKILKEQLRFLHKARKDNGRYRTPVGKFINKAGKAARLYRQVKRLNEAAEGFSRKIEFKNVYNKKIRDGFSKTDALQAATFYSIDLMDFGRGGTITKGLNNNLFMFLNAQVQGANKMARTFREGDKKDKATQIFRFLYTQILPDMAIRTLAYNMADDEQKALLNALTPRMQLMYNMIPYTDRLGISGIWKVPKAFETGAVASLISTSALNLFRSQNEQITMDGAGDALATSVPLWAFLNGQRLTGGAGIAGVTLELMRNQVAYTGKAIDPTVKYGTGGFPNLSSSRASSSILGRSISDGLVKVGLSGLGMSPKMVDYFFQNIFARWGDMGIKMLKVGEDIAKGEATSEDGVKVMKDILYKGRFTNVFSPYLDVNYIKMSDITSYGPSESRSKTKAINGVNSMNIPDKDKDKIVDLVALLFDREKTYDTSWGKDVERFDAGIKLIEVSRELYDYNEKYDLIQGLYDYEKTYKEAKLEKERLKNK